MPLHYLFLKPYPPKSKKQPHLCQNQISGNINPKTEISPDPKNSPISQNDNKITLKLELKEI